MVSGDVRVAVPDRGAVAWRRQGRADGRGHVRSFGGARPTGRVCQLSWCSCSSGISAPHSIEDAAAAGRRAAQLGADRAQLEAALQLMSQVHPARAVLYVRHMCNELLLVILIAHVGRLCTEACMVDV